MLIVRIRDLITGSGGVSKAAGTSPRRIKGQPVYTAGRFEGESNGVNGISHSRFAAARHHNTLKVKIMFILC